MCYYRNYTPVFKTTNEEYLATIKQKLKESYHKLVILPNDQPYNCKALEQNIEVEHLVLWYSKETDMHWLLHSMKEYENK